MESARHAPKNAAFGRRRDGAPRETRFVCDPIVGEPRLQQRRADASVGGKNDLLG